MMKIETKQYCLFFRHHCFLNIWSLIFLYLQHIANWPDLTSWISKHHTEHEKNFFFLIVIKTLILFDALHGTANYARTTDVNTGVKKLRPYFFYTLYLSSHLNTKSQEALTSISTWAGRASPHIYEWIKGLTTCASHKMSTVKCSILWSGSWVIKVG